MRAQVLRPGGRHRDEGAALRAAMPPDEPAVGRVLPHRQPRARGPPRIQHLRVRPWIGAQPLEEVQHEAVEAAGPRWLRTGTATLTRDGHGESIAPISIERRDRWSQLDSASALSRRRFVQTAAIAAAGATGSLAGPARTLADGHRRHGGPSAVPPTPISGGIQIPDGPQIHVWAPGDPSVTLPLSGMTLMGFEVDASAITDFRGFSAVAFHLGT